LRIRPRCRATRKEVNREGARLLTAVNNRALRNLVTGEYRHGARIGNGSTAAAVRDEVARSVPYKAPGAHFQKAQNDIRAAEQDPPNRETFQPRAPDRHQHPRRAWNALPPHRRPSSNNAMTHHMADVERMLRERLPEFGAHLDQERPGWDPDDDAFYRGSIVLGDLRLWLLARRGRRHRDIVAEAFDVVEALCRDADDDLRGALAVELLEGTWPAGHLELMGPKTRAVRDLAQHPPWAAEDHD
jgi:hypothetical protein